MPTYRKDKEIRRGWKNYPAHLCEQIEKAVDPESEDGAFAQQISDDLFTIASGTKTVKEIVRAVESKVGRVAIKVLTGTGLDGLDECGYRIGRKDQCVSLRIQFGVFGDPLNLDSLDLNTPTIVRQLAAMPPRIKEPTVTPAPKEVAADVPPATPKTDDGRDGWVYFMGVLDTVKIGHSHDPIHRLKTIQTMSPFEVKLLAKTPGTQRTESEFHDRFARYHIRGEWFRLAGESKDYVYGLQPRGRFTHNCVGA